MFKLNKKNSLTLFLFLILISTKSFSKPIVNILTWWGYLDRPWIAEMITKECHSQISFDEYYSNMEFLRRLKDQNTEYDIIIFADTIYKSIKDDIKVNNSHLNAITSNYYKPIREHYIRSGYPANLVYFYHSVTGFLWNPDVINISKKDTLNEIFKKAGKNLVVMIDDPVEIKLIFNPYTSENFRNIKQNSKLFITNEFNQIYKRHDLAFAYLWSGEALQDAFALKTNYKFLLHPKYSFFSSDLLAVLNNKASSNCVARVLASKELLTKLQNETYYFSPYGNMDHIDNPDYKKIYKLVYKNLPNLKWIESISKNDFKKINQTWNYLKLDMLNENKKSH